MKIRLSKKKNSVSLRISAQSDDEAVDLKDAVLAMGEKEASWDSCVKAAELLAERGYTGEVTKETRNTKEFTLSKPETEE